MTRPRWKTQQQRDIMWCINYRTGVAPRVLPSSTAKAPLKGELAAAQPLTEGFLP